MIYFLLVLAIALLAWYLWGDNIFIPGGVKRKSSSQSPATGNGAKENFPGEEKKLPISLSRNYAYGVAINIVLYTVMWAFLRVYIGPLHILSEFSLFVLTFLLFFIPGLRKNQIGFNGVPTLFGRRVAWFLLSEGWVWVFPYIMDMISVDRRILTIVIPKVSFMSKNNIRMKTTDDVRITWEIFDPSLSLSVEEEILEEPSKEKGKEMSLEGALDDLVKNMFRVAGKRFTDEDFMSGTAADDKGFADQTVEGCNKRSREWGIRVHRAFVPPIMPENQAVSAAYEKRLIEKQEMEGEKIERDFLQESMNALSSNGQHMSRELAGALFQAERGKKTPVRKLIIEGDKGKPVVQAAGIINDGLTNQGKEG